MVIEVGHKATTLKEPIGNLIYKWNLFLRSGDERQQIDKVVQKVVFNLHETFKNPVRVCTQPPYCVKENGYGEFAFPIDIYFKGTSDKYTIEYFLELPPANSLTPLNRFRKEKITFLNPCAELRSLLIESGATLEIIAANNTTSTSSNTTTNCLNNKTTVQTSKKTNQQTSPQSISNNNQTMCNNNLNNNNNLNANSNLNQSLSSTTTTTTTSSSSTNVNKLNSNANSTNTTSSIINGSSFLASNSAFPSEKKKQINNRKVI